MFWLSLNVKYVILRQAWILSWKLTWQGNKLRLSSPHDDSLWISPLPSIYTVIFLTGPPKKLEYKKLLKYGTDPKKLFKYQSLSLLLSVRQDLAIC